MPMPTTELAKCPVPGCGERCHIQRGSIASGTVVCDNCWYQADSPAVHRYICECVGYIKSMATLPCTCGNEGNGFCFTCCARAIEARKEGK